MSLWLAIPIGLALYAAFVIFLGHFLHAGGATRDVRDD
jgi:hypothetical protein